MFRHTSPKVSKSDGWKVSAAQAAHVRSVVAVPGKLIYVPGPHNCHDTHVVPTKDGTGWYPLVHVAHVASDDVVATVLTYCPRTHRRCGSQAYCRIEAANVPGTHAVQMMSALVDSLTLMYIPGAVHNLLTGAHCTFCWRSPLLSTYSLRHVTSLAPAPVVQSMVSVRLTGTSTSSSSSAVLLLLRS